MNNFKDFRIAFLHSKFGTHNSLLVPNQKVILNEDFVNWKDLLRIPEQIDHFKVYWFAKGISGEICVPGQWNYAYIDGRFYHLVKMHSNGFVKGVEEEWFYYNVIYDDGQNDWMNNTFYLKGTIELTGDQELVRQHLYQTSPIIENVNGFRFLNGVERGNTDETKTVFKVAKLPNAMMQINGLSSNDRIAINNELKAFYERGENLTPPDEKLLIPFMYRVPVTGNWKGCILKGIHRIVNEGLKVFDVTVESVSDAGQAGKFRNILENMLGTSEIYTVTNRDHRVYSFAKAVNPTKWVSEIDLSECNDITIIDRLRLVPLYGIENVMPTFTIKGFVDKICNRHQGPSSYKDEMVKMFEDLVVPRLAPIINFDDNRGNKVFKNVSLEKIDRDIVDVGDARGSVKNPEGKTWSESRIIGLNRHKNFIWDNNCIEGDPCQVHILNGFDSDINYSLLNNDEKTDLQKDGRGLIDMTANADVMKKFNVHSEYISGSNSFIYLPDEYKLVSGDDTTDFLDFTKNLNDLQYAWFALIPNYDNKSYVLSAIGTTSEDNYQNLILDPKNPAYSDRRFPALGGEEPSNYPTIPVVFNEIISVKENDVVLDWEKPTNDILKAYLELGKDYTHPSEENRWEDRNRQSTFRAGGAEGLSKGGIFALLTYNRRNFKSRSSNQTGYYIAHKNGNSTCYGNYCDHGYGTSNQSPSARTAVKRSYIQGPESVYTNDKHEWRRFHTEMTFPVKCDGGSIIDILRKYDDIPDNFLRWEVVNTGIKKGVIKGYMRGIQKTSSGRINCSRFSENDEKQIPKNTVVMVWITHRPSGSPDKDYEFDKKAIDDYDKDPNRPYWEHKLQSRLFFLMGELHKYFFLTKGENGGNTGAIPVRLRNETNLNSTVYPKSGGHSQLGLSGAKPHKGFGYVAGTRFTMPDMTDEFRFTEQGYLDFNKEGTEDGIFTVIPNKYKGTGPSDAYKPRFTYREKIGGGNISSNLLLAFLSGVIVQKKTELDSKEGDYLSGMTNGDDVPGLNDFFMITGGNKEASNKLSGGAAADYLFDRFRKHFYNGNTLTLNDFFSNARSYKTKRIFNPKEIPVKWKSTKSYTEYGEEIEFISFDKEVPPFMIPYLDPEHKEGALNGGLYKDTQHITYKEDRLQLYKEKLELLVRYTLQMLESWNTWIRFDGTNGYASIKLNNKDGIPKWDYELFTNEITTFKTKEEKKWNFINHKENDVDVLINTRNEINIYGNKFPLKSRNISNEAELDLGLHVKPLLDVKQTQAAAGYAVKMNLNEQDIIQTFIETPKELTNYSGFSAYEREKLIREIGLRGQEYMYNVQMLDYQKEENKFTNQYEKDWIYKEGKYDVARGATQIIGGVLDVATGGAGVVASAVNMVGQTTINKVFDSGYGGGVQPYMRNIEGDGFTTDIRFNSPAMYRGHYREVPGKTNYFNYNNPYARNNLAYLSMASRRGAQAGGGLMGIVGGGLTIAEAYETFNIKDEYRKQKYAMAEKKLASEGDILNKRHEYERKNLLNDLWAMSANVVYPQLNANIVYKLYNESMGINDIHMVQYYPKGKILEYIKNYYREFGYNIMVRNFECTGIKDVKKHLRYQFIYEINHPNICAQEMIRARALAGVKVIEWRQ